MNNRCTETERWLKIDSTLEKHLKRRPDVTEKYCQVLEANVAKGYIQILEQGEVNDEPS